MIMANECEYYLLCAPMQTSKIISANKSYSFGHFSACFRFATGLIKLLVGWWRDQHSPMVINSRKTIKFVDISTLFRDNEYDVLLFRKIRPKIYLPQIRCINFHVSKISTITDYSTYMQFAELSRVFTTLVWLKLELPQSSEMKQ